MAQQEKDPVAVFEQLYIKYRTLLHQVAYSLSNDNFLSEDMVHEAFSWIIAHPDTLTERSHTQIKNILCMICRSRTISALRKSKLESPLDELMDRPAMDECFSNPLNLVLRKESISIIMQIISELGQVEQDIFLLSSAFHLKAGVIADLYGVEASFIYKINEKTKCYIAKELHRREMM